MRWERQHVLGRDADVGIRDQQELGAAHRRRLGSDEHRQGKIYANYGRFYENIPKDINIRAFGGELRRLRATTSRRIRPTPRRSTGTPSPELAARRRDRAGRSEPEGPVHRRVPRSATNTKSRPNLTVGIRYIHRKLGRRDRGLPGAVERRDTSSPTPARDARPASASTTADVGAGAEGEAQEHEHRADAARSACEELAVHRQLRLVEARRQLRRHVPELDRPAGSEHQLGVRLRGLHGQRATGS